MSTRSTTHFVEGERKGAHSEAIIYRHTDGYPEGHGIDLQRFFDDVEAQTDDHRYRDPSYLAAKLVVWLAGEFARDPKRPLDFLSVGVVSGDPSDIEYRYIVDCGDLGENGRPKVTCIELGGWGETLGKVVPIPAAEPVK